MTYSTLATTLILGLGLAGVGSAALAAPSSYTPPPAAQSSSFKAQTWKDRFIERRSQQWSKPTGGFFSKPFQATPSSVAPLAARNQGVTSPVTRSAPLVDPALRDRARALNSDRATPWDVTGGFGKEVRRPTSHLRLGWERRGGRITTVALADAPRGKRDARLGGKGAPTLKAHGRKTRSVNSGNTRKVFKPAKVSHTPVAPRFRPAR